MNGSENLSGDGQTQPPLSKLQLQQWLQIPLPSHLAQHRDLYYLQVAIGRSYEHMGSLRKDQLGYIPDQGEFLILDDDNKTVFLPLWYFSGASQIIGKYMDTDIGSPHLLHRSYLTSVEQFNQALVEIASRLDWQQAPKSQEAPSLFVNLLLSHPLPLSNVCRMAGISVPEGMEPFSPSVSLTNKYVNEARNVQVFSLPTGKDTDLLKPNPATQLVISFCLVHYQADPDFKGRYQNHLVEHSSSPDLAIIGMHRYSMPTSPTNMPHVSVLFMVESDHIENEKFPAFSPKGITQPLSHMIPMGIKTGGDCIFMERPLQSYYYKMIGELSGHTTLLRPITDGVRQHWQQLMAYDNARSSHLFLHLSHHGIKGYSRTSTKDSGKGGMKH